MNDQEFLERIEHKLIYQMFEGCLCDEHLGNKVDPASWGVSLRADEMSRLLDMAKGSRK